MEGIGLKSVVVMFPWEDSVRTISFGASDHSAVAVLYSLIEDKGAQLFSVEGFSAEEIDFLSSYLDSVQFF